MPSALYIPPKKATKRWRWKKYMTTRNSVHYRIGCFSIITPSRTSTDPSRTISTRWAQVWQSPMNSLPRSWNVIPSRVTWKTWPVSSCRSISNGESAKSNLRLCKSRFIIAPVKADSCAWRWVASLTASCRYVWVGCHATPMRPATSISFLTSPSSLSLSWVPNMAIGKGALWWANMLLSSSKKKVMNKTCVYLTTKLTMLPLDVLRVEPQSSTLYKTTAERASPRPQVSYYQLLYETALPFVQKIANRCRKVRAALALSTRLFN